MSGNDSWDDEYYPNLPRPRFRSPLRHAQRLKKGKESKTAPKSERTFPEVKVLHVGHCTKFKKTGDVFASSTVTLIKGLKFNILVDTMTAWDGPKLENLLMDEKIHPDEIHYVVCTNSKSDRTGCNYLFKDAFHIVGNSMCHGERHIGTPLDTGGSFFIEPKIEIVCTPSKKSADGISVLVTTETSRVAITGDLFETESTLRAYMEEDTNKEAQVSQDKIIEWSEKIIPGRGPMFSN